MSKRGSGPTDWEEGSQWYDSIVGSEGHYYHKNVILPALAPLLALKKDSSLLDLGCGQGVLARTLAKECAYVGIDLSPSLIQKAKSQATKNQEFIKSDITEPLPLKGRTFTHATSVLALQNVENPLLALKQASLHLEPAGVLVLVLNHPAFRIPRQSHWGVDEAKKLQYRRVDRYLSPLKIPIQTHPGKNEGTSLSFHHSLSAFSRFLFEAGFATLFMEEWISDKKSTGGAAKMEDRARQEFPLFLAIKAVKLK